MFRFFLKLALLAPAWASVANRNAHSHLKGNKVLAPVAGVAQEAFQKAFKMFEASAPSDGKAPAAGGKQPVGVQVDEKVMKKLHEELSDDCSKRYKNMMQGEGPAMHNYEDHDEKSKSDKCEKEYKGSRCHTLAEISEAKQVPDGRHMEARTSVEGMSCLPKECTSKKDLTVLAKFMHGQTKEIFPDEAIKVGLHVDCSASGGAIVDADGNPDTPSSPQPEKPRSGASALSALFGIAPLLIFFTSF